MKPYFPHIEGLRFVAALLVAIYHIWTNRISGGVDVFFVVSGLLVTLTLLRQAESRQRLDLVGFFSGLTLRLLPASMLVLLLVAAGSYFLLPSTVQLDTAREIFAAALYIENWQLAVKAVDYLDRDNIASPVQHFWAMSVQGQFYVYAAILFGLGFALRRLPGGLFRQVLILNGAAIALSFAYSVYQTHFGDQPWAYFDTFARIWEFGLGAMAALLVTRKPDFSLPIALGWIGLIAILLCGLVFNVGSVFPGAAALFPVAAALLVVFGGRGSSPWSVQTLLGSRALVSLGSVSYGIYLFHWPLLVFYQHLSGARPGLVTGVSIIAASIALAYLTRQFVELPAQALKAGGDARKKLRVIALALVPLVAITGVNYAGQRSVAKRELARELAIREAASAKPALLLTKLSDAAVMAEPKRFIPVPSVARVDRPEYYPRRCNVKSTSSTIIWCTFGLAEGFERTIAMVGGSHTGHWLPALDRVARKHKWRVLLTAWGGCQFMVDRGTERCRTLSRTALKELPEQGVDIVFTTAGVSNQPSPDRNLATWKELGRLGIPVVAVRGTPRHPKNIPDCIASGAKYRTCGSPRKRVLAPKFDLSRIPANVTVFDLSDYFCGKTFCPAASDSTIIYKDRHHITTTFMKKLTSQVEKHVVPAMEKAVLRRGDLSNAAVEAD